MLVDFRDIVFININFDQKNILYTTPKKINLISHFPKQLQYGEIFTDKRSEKPHYRAIQTDKPVQK
jgi:hypothetical protein